MYINIYVYEDIYIYIYIHIYIYIECSSRYVLKLWLQSKGTQGLRAWETCAESEYTGFQVPSTVPEVEG